MELSHSVAPSVTDNDEEASLVACHCQFEECVDPRVDLNFH